MSNKRTLTCSSKRTKKNARAPVDRAKRSLQQYLAEMEKFSLIATEDEFDCGRQIQECQNALLAFTQALPREISDFCSPKHKASCNWKLNELYIFFERLDSYLTTHPAALNGEKRRYRDALANLRRASDASNKLILANLRLVVYIAKHYQKNGVDFEDLVQEGNLGLMRATQRFDYRLGNKFATYAFWWIKQSIERATTEKGRTIRVPTHKSEDERRVKRAKKSLESRIGRVPTTEEIAAVAGMTVKEVRDRLSIVKEPILFEDRNRSGELKHPVDRMPDSSTPPRQFEWNLRRELCEKIRQKLSVLSPRDATIMRMRFGIDYPTTYTMKEVGGVVGLSRERVRQIQVQSLERLKRVLADLKSLISH